MRIRNKWYKELWWWIVERYIIIKHKITKKPIWYGLRFRGKPIICDEEYEALPDYMKEINDKRNKMSKM